MNLERFVKLMTWLSKRYPGAYIVFDTDIDGFELWDSYESWKEWWRLEDESWKGSLTAASVVAFKKKHLKVRLFGINREELK